MSWAEIKKAVNSNLQEPLDRLIKRIVNSSSEESLDKLIGGGYSQPQIHLLPRIRVSKGEKITVLSLNGRGMLNFFSIYGDETTSSPYYDAQMSMTITVDGIVNQYSNVRLTDTEYYLQRERGGKLAMQGRPTSVPTSYGSIVGWLFYQSILTGLQPLIRFNQSLEIVIENTTPDFNSYIEVFWADSFYSLYE